jgi:hypothetical protein
MNDLQAKYIAHFVTRAETMSIADAAEYLAWLRDNPAAEFRDSRINELSRYLHDTERREAAESDLNRRQIAAARESCALTEKWEQLGASWRAQGTFYTVWEYGGTEFYRWGSGVDVLDELPRKIKADERLLQLIDNEMEAN